jgi:hypothetical protein
MSRKATFKDIHRLRAGTVFRPESERCEALFILAEVPPKNAASCIVHELWDHGSDKAPGKVPLRIMLEEIDPDRPIEVLDPADLDIIIGRLVHSQLLTSS